MDSSKIARDLFEGLYNQDSQGNLIPGVALSHTVSDDKTVYTFKLRDNAKWSDGKPVTANDFVYAWRRLADPATASAYQWYINVMGVKNNGPVTDGSLPPSELGVAALDVTVQEQIMDLLASLQRDLDMAMILITHDLGLVASSCRDMLVMYGGQVMEYGKTIDLFEAPSHPYTRGLLSAIPRLDQQSDSLVASPGNPPNMMAPPSGCSFHPRCAFADAGCSSHNPTLTLYQDRQRACLKSAEELS